MPLLHSRPPSVVRCTARSLVAASSEIGGSGTTRRSFTCTAVRPESTAPVAARSSRPTHSRSLPTRTRGGVPGHGGGAAPAPASLPPTSPIKLAGRVLHRTVVAAAHTLAQSRSIWQYPRCHGQSVRRRTSSRRVAARKRFPSGCPVPSAIPNGLRSRLTPKVVARSGGFRREDECDPPGVAAASVGAGASPSLTTFRSPPSRVTCTPSHESRMLGQNAIVGVRSPDRWSPHGSTRSRGAASWPAVARRNKARSTPRAP